MTKLTNATVGVYAEWVSLLSPEAQMIANCFRPWERYTLDETDVLVSVQGYETNGAVNVRVDTTGEIIKAAEPWRLRLWCIPDLDEAPVGVDSKAA